MMKKKTGLEGNSKTCLSSGGEKALKFFLTWCSENTLTFDLFLEKRKQKKYYADLLHPVRDPL